jgi:polysaccharide pyruvyl transferase WcaK-like protein
LYSYILPKAEKIMVRDRDSREIAKKMNPENAVLYQDFAQEIILRNEEQGKRDEEKKSNPKFQVVRPYILININRQSVDTENIQKIIHFCSQYPDHKKLFFPCDMNDDKHCFTAIKKHIPGLENYDRTKHSLSESLSLFSHADG